MQPDAIIEVRFMKPSENGRQTAIAGEYYGCPLVIEGEAFDCRLLLAGSRIELGETVMVPMKLLNPQFALPKLRNGQIFQLWEGKNVAVGKVVRVIGTGMAGGNGDL
jgi:hypothetical protein